MTHSYIVENLDPKEKMVEHIVKFEKDESLNLDNCNIYLGTN